MVHAAVKSRVDFLAVYHVLSAGFFNKEKADEDNAEQYFKKSSFMCKV
jgi:hypothetical protein